PDGTRRRRNRASREWPPRAAPHAHPGECKTCPLTFCGSPSELGSVLLLILPISGSRRAIGVLAFNSRTGQEYRRRLHGQREPAQQTHDLHLRLALGRIAELPARLVALDHLQRGSLRQLVDWQEGPVGLLAEQLVLTEPRGGNDVQPVGLRQPG